MDLSVSIFNFDVEFFPPTGQQPAKVTWNGSSTPPTIDITTDYALITASLSVNGGGEVSWLSDPINWQSNGRSIATPYNFTVRRESDTLATIIDYNDNESETDVSFYFLISLEYEGKVYTFDPSIINMKPGG